jgi:hypothetical protein
MNNTSAPLKTPLARAIGILAVLFLAYELVVNIGSLKCKWAMCDASASATAWIDQNNNGLEDAGEIPLHGVCVWFELSSPLSTNIDQTGDCSTSSSRTDQQGVWGGGFLPGGNCSEIYIFVKPPTGYEPTTPVMVHGCIAQFGFVPTGSVPAKRLLSPDEIIRRENLWRTFQQIASFLALIIVVIDGLAT